MIESGYYPPGAEHDPDAPYNQSEPEEIEVEVVINQTLSKSTKILTTDYIVNEWEDFEPDEEGRFYRTGGIEYDFSDSDLKGVTIETLASSIEEAETGKTVLTLGIKNKVVGFRKPAGGIVGANKAYLLVTTPSGGSTAPELVIGIDDDETTGINGVKADNADVDAPMFNIAGQRVSNNAKGLVIKNGKKYMLK